MQLPDTHDLARALLQRALLGSVSLSDATEKQAAQRFGYLEGSQEMGAQITNQNAALSQLENNAALGNSQIQFAVQQALAQKDIGEQNLQNRYQQAQNAITNTNLAGSLQLSAQDWAALSKIGSSMMSMASSGLGEGASATAGTPAVAANSINLASTPSGQASLQLPAWQPGNNLGIANGAIVAGG